MKAGISLRQACPRAPCTHAPDLHTGSAGPKDPQARAMGATAPHPIEWTAASDWKGHTCGARAASGKPRQGSKQEEKGPRTSAVEGVVLRNV